MARVLYSDLTPQQKAQRQAEQEAIKKRKEQEKEKQISQIRKSGGGWVTGSIEQFPSGKSIKTETYSGGTITTTSSPVTYQGIAQKQMFGEISKAPTQSEIKSSQTSVSPVTFTDTLGRRDKGTIVNVVQIEQQRAMIQKAVEMAKKYPQTPTKSKITTSYVGGGEIDTSSFLGKIKQKYQEQTGMTTNIQSNLQRTQMPKDIQDMQSFKLQETLVDISAPQREYTYGLVGKKGMVTTTQQISSPDLYMISSKGVYSSEKPISQMTSMQKEQTEQVARIIDASATKQAFTSAEQKLSKGIISFDIRDYNQPAEVMLPSLIETTTGLERVRYGLAFGVIKTGQQAVQKFENIVAEVVSPIGLGTLALGGVASKIAPNLLTVGYTGLTVAIVSKEAQKSFVDIQNQDKLTSQKIESAVQPISTAVAFYGFAKTYQATMEYFPVRYTVLELPKKNGMKIMDVATGISKPETEVIWRGLSFEIRGTGFGKQLIGVSKGKVVVGEGYLKNIKLSDYNMGELISSDIYFPEGSSASARRKLLPKYDKAMQDADVYFRRKSQFAKSPYTREEFIKETKSLSQEQIKEVLATAQKYGGKIEGSFVQRGHLKEGRLAGDIDIHFNELGTDVVEGITKNLVKELNVLAEHGKGNPVRISQERTTLVEANVGGKWIHATDIFSFEQGTLGSYSLGFKMEKSPQYIEGIKSQRIGEQALRKGNSIFQFKSEGGKIAFQPEQHRVKDVGDYFTIQKTLFENRPQVLSRLQKLETSYKAQLPTAVVNEMGKQGTVEIPVAIYTPASAFVSNAGQFASGFSAIISGSEKSIVSDAIGKSITPKEFSQSITSYSKSQSVTPSKSYSSSSLSKSVSASSSSMSRSMSTSVSASKSQSRSNSLSRSVSSSLSGSFSGSMSSSMSSTSSSSSSTSISSSISSSSSSSSVSRSVSGSPSASSSSGKPYSFASNFPTSKGYGKKKGKKYEKGFGIFVRKGGKFKQIGRTALPEAEAKSMMFKELKGTARASGFIKPTNQMVEAKPTMFGAFGSLGTKNQFYTKKEKGQKIYIQKTQFRISSMGEKREISLKGVAVQQQRRMFGNIMKGMKL